MLPRMLVVSGRRSVGMPARPVDLGAQTNAFIGIRKLSPYLFRPFRVEAIVTTLSGARSKATLCLLALTACVYVVAVADSQAADREWSTGVWAKPATQANPASSSRNYAIETDRLRLDVQLTDARQGPPLVATVGTTVTFAVGANTVYIREGARERILHLLKRTEKLKTYAAAGAGHYLKVLADNGLTLTLEDGSVWEISPQYQYRTKGWLPFAGITVSHDSRELTAVELLREARIEYDYFVNNTDEDDGASARLVSTP